MTETTQDAEKDATETAAGDGKDQEKEVPDSEEKPEAGAAEKAPEKKEEEPPEKYELKLPEGAVLGPDYLERTAAVARELGLTNEEAQDLLEHDNEVAAAHLELVNAQFTAKQKEWAEELKADKEIGGEKLEESLQRGMKVINQFGSKKLQDALDSSGLKNYPELLRMLVKIEKATASDEFVDGKTKTSEKRPTDKSFGAIAERMYGGKT